MCNSLQLIPLFIARMMPKTYIKAVTNSGGFVLLMKYQFYPFAHRDFAKLVADLGLPVDCPAPLLTRVMLTGS